MNGSRLASAFYSNPRLTVVAVAFILVAGLAALQTLARQEDPTMTRRFAMVETELPGATAGRVETLVTERLEARLREISEIRELNSISRAGRSFIIVRLSDGVGPSDVDVVWSEVRDKLTEAQSSLPAAASRPLLDVRELAATTLAVAFTWRGEGETQLGMLTRLARELEIRLANLAGTRETTLYGAAEEEVRVTVDPRTLAGTGLTAEALAARILAADTRLPSGRLQGPASELLIEVMGELDSTERILAIPLARQAGGEMLRVGDIADVRKTLRDPPTSIAIAEGQRAVVLGAQMEANQRVDRWVADARMAVERYAATLPPQIRLDVVFDQNTFTEERLADLTVNLVMALAIILLLLLFFMGVRSAITVGIALPLSMAMVLSGLMFLDIPLHQMSVTGLIISLGLLIDNAIVVVEEYKLRRRRGLDIAAAIGGSVRRLFVPLVASTATTVFAFMPIAFSPGSTGEFTGTLAISVILSVSSSFLLAMTVVPAVAGFLERRFPLRRDADDRHWWVNGFSHGGMRRIYRRSLEAALRRPALGIGAGLVLPVAGFALAATLTMQFFPPVDRDQFQVQLLLPAESSIAETQANVARLRAILGEYDEVVSDYFFIGQNPPRVFYNVIANSDGVAGFAAGFVATRSHQATRQLLPRLQRRLIAEFPNARVLALPFEQGPPFDAPIEVRIVGDDLAILRQLGEDVRRVLAATEGVTYTHAALASAEPKLAVYPDETLANQAGLALSDLPAQLSTSLSGQPAGMIMEGTHELPVRVRYGNSSRASLSDLAALPIVSNGGDSNGFVGIPLEQLATVRLEPAASSIERFQGERINTVQGFLLPYVLPAAALADFDRRFEAAGLALPAGYRIEFGGEAEERNESVGNLLRTFVLFLMLMVAVIVLSMNSFRHAALIGLVGFLSIGLALFGIRLFGWPLGFTAIIGTLGLVGLAINGAIIVLSALKADPEAMAGSTARSVDVVMDSSRHILSTTATTIGGFLPLILFGGTFWPPLATAIAGGVAGSAILALYLVPAVFILIARRSPAAAAASGATAVLTTLERRQRAETEPYQSTRRAL